MRIGFYGNSGNYPLMLARALRRLGHEVLFTLSNEAQLDRPENRYAELGPPYPEWIRDFSPMWKTYFPTPWRRQCVRLLRTCDLVVLSHIGPSLAADIGRPAIALLTGIDVLYFANPEAVRLMTEETHRQPDWIATPLKLATFAELVRNQRAGIGGALLVTHFARGLVPEGDRILDEIGIGDSRRMMMLMTETDRVAYAPPPNNARVRAFCAARLNWKRPVPPGLAELDYKGSDVMIRGIGLFVREHGPCLDVRLVRKGLHLAETVELIREEGFANQVTWLGEMSQEAVLREFAEADILFDQLDRSVVAMAGLDGMATGRPVIANGRPEWTQAAIGAPSPICQARTPQEVADQLRRLVVDAAERGRVGMASRRYVEEYFSADAAARRFLDRISAEVG